MLWEKVWKIPKPPATLIWTIAIHTYQKYLNPSGDPVPLKVAQLLDKFYLWTNNTKRIKNYSTLFYFLESFTDSTNPPESIRKKLYLADFLSFGPIRPRGRNPRNSELPAWRFAAPLPPLSETLPFQSSPPKQKKVSVSLLEPLKLSVR